MSLSGCGWSHTLNTFCADTCPKPLTVLCMALRALRISPSAVKMMASSPARVDNIKYINTIHNNNNNPNRKVYSPSRSYDTFSSAATSCRRVSTSASCSLVKRSTAHLHTTQHNKVSKRRKPYTTSLLHYCTTALIHTPLTETELAR